MTRKISSREVAEFLAEKIDRYGKCILPGLGTLRLVQRAGRHVRHPATGQIYAIPPRPALTFKLSKPRKRP